MKPIPSNPGYFATADGHIRGLRGKYKVEHRQDGYLMVIVKCGDKLKRRPVHALVCEAFHGRRPLGKVCRHRDGNKSNNTPKNLRWGTPRENCDDKIRLGEMPRGERHCRSKLTAGDVRLIRAFAALPGAGSQKSLGKVFGISQECVSAIVRRKTWRHAI